MPLKNPSEDLPARYREFRNDKSNMQEQKRQSCISGYDSPIWIILCCTDVETVFLLEYRFKKQGSLCDFGKNEPSPQTGIELYNLVSAMGVCGCSRPAYPATLG